MQLANLPAVLEQYERDHGVSVGIMFHSDGSGTFLIYGNENLSADDIQDEMLEDALDEIEEMSDEEVEALEAELDEEIEIEEDLDDATELLEGPTLYATTHKVYFDSIRELGGLLILPPSLGDHKLN